MLLRLLLLCLLALPLIVPAQGLNGGFEAIHENGNPAGWSKTLTSAASLTADAYSGNKAAKAWVYEYYQSGGWVSITNRLAASADNSSSKLPTQLSGVYKYEGRKQECDPALVQVLATRRNANGGFDTLASGQVELKLSKDYRTFSLPVSQTGRGPAPEFLSVKIEARGHCDWLRGSNCCFLFADDLQFDEAYSAGVPVADNPPATVAAEEKSSVTEPVFIQPMRKRKPLFKRYVLKPGKRAKPVKQKKNKKVRRGKKARKPVPVAPPAEETPSAIPPEIQKEIDRINAAQSDTTPDPAKAAEEIESPDSDAPDQDAPQMNLPDPEAPTPDEDGPEPDPAHSEDD
ncbi:MAG: hypothetical protein AAGN35_19945 [Bacteroidota bacterium]